MTSEARNLVSRITLAVVAAVLLYWAYRVGLFTYDAFVEARQMRPQPRRIPFPLLPFLLGLLLALTGIVCALGAVIPTRLIEKVIRPPDLRMHENPDHSGPYRF